MTKEKHRHPYDVSTYLYRTAVLLARAPFGSSWSPLSTAKAVSSSSTSQQHALSPSRTKSTASRFSIFRRKAAESRNSSEPRSVVADKGHFLETSGTGSNAFLDHPFIRTVADLFNENGNEIEIRKQLELMRTTCTEKDYMNDLKQCVSAIHYGQPWPGRRADFPSSSSSSASNTEFFASFPIDPQEADRLGDEEYSKWSAKELAELSSMMADMCERDPALFKVSKEPEERHASSVSPSVFTFIPPDPRAYYRHLLSRMLTHDLEAMEALGPDEDVSVGILSNDHLGLLDELARCWRVNDGWRRAVRFELIRELYEDGQCPLESLGDALRMILEPAYTTPPGSTRTQTMTKGWMIYERDLLSISLNRSFRSVVRWLYNELQDPFGVDVEQATLHLTFLQDIHSTGLLFEPPDPNLTASSQERMPLSFTAVNINKHIEELKDAVQIGAINMYAEHTAELFGKVLPPGSNEVKPLLELCDWVTSRAKILEKQWNSHARVFDIDIVALVLRKQVPLFLDDLESMKQSVLDRTNALPLNDPKSTHFDQIFGLFRTVRGLFQLYATFCPEQMVQGAEVAHLLAQKDLPEGEQDESWPGDQLTGTLQKDAALLAKVGRLNSFSLSRWFEPHVRDWLQHMELEVHDWVQNALKRDQFEPVDPEVGAMHSSSIGTLFKALQQPIDLVLDLDWPDKLVNARFLNGLAKIVSSAVERYCAKVEELFKDELRFSATALPSGAGGVGGDGPGLNGEGGMMEVESSGSKGAAWMGMARAKLALQGVPKVEPFHFQRRSCVKLNNIEAARNLLDKLYSKMDADEQARIVNRHAPPPEVAEKPGQAVSQQGGAPQAPRQRFLFTVKILLGEGLSSVSSSSSGSAGSSGSGSVLDSFVTLSDESGKTVAKTRTIAESRNPRWNETVDFTVEGNEGNTSLVATVWSWHRSENPRPYGRTNFQLDPQLFGDSLPHELWLDLDTEGKLLIRVSMEEEKDDIFFNFGKTFRILKRAENAMIRAIVDKMSVYIQHSLSRQVLESLVKAWDYKALHAPALASKPSNPAIPSPVSSGVGASSELTDSEIEEPILPLLDYLDECLKMLKWSLCDAEAQLVLKKVWKEVLRIIEDILVPPLGETLAIMRLLSDREVDIVFKWLHFLRSYFNARDEETGVEAGVPLEVLQGPKFREIISYSLFRHMGTDQLVTEIRRLVQQRDRAQLTAVGKSQMATRKVTVYSERNLETIRQHKREKVGKAEEAGELELLLRVLRMRSGADDYLPEMHRLVRSGAEGDIVAAEADVHQQPSTDHVQLPIPSQIRPSSHAKSKQKEPAQRIRPATIQELANAGEVVFNPATPIREVLMGAADLVTLAETYLNVKPEPDYQQAFICLTKAGRLLLDVLPNQHPGWKSELDLAARIKVKNDAEAVIDQLSKCRPILVDAFDRWKAQNPDLDINTVPTALTQQQQQQRKPLPPLPVQSGLAQSQAGKEPPSIQPAPFSSSSASHAAERRTATMHDTGQHRLPTHIPILARSLPVAHTPMFDTVREQEKPSTGEDDVKVRRTLYEGPSTTFETMSERPRPWRAETQESCGTSHEAEAAIMNGRLGCLLLSFPASAAFLLLVAMFSRSSSNWQGTQDPPRLGLVAFLLMVSLRSTFLVHLPLVHIVRVMMGSNSPAAKHLGGLIHHGRQVLLVADIVIVVVLALCHIDGTSWYHAAVRYVGLQRVNEGCNELGTPHTQPSLDQKFTPPAGPREDTPETKPARTATKGQRPSSLRIFVLFLVCQAAVILLHLVAYFEGHLTRLGPVQGRAAPSWQHFAFLLLLLAVSMDVSLFSHRQLTLSPVLTAIFGSRPFVTPLQDLVEHVRLVCLQVDLVAVLGLAFLFCTGGSWYEAAANHIGLETRTVVAAGATSSSPHVKANAPLSHSVTLAPTVADVGPTDGFESGPDSEEEAEVQGYLIENDASDQRHERPTDTAPATESINVDEGIPRDHDRKGKSRQAESAADQVASLLSKLKADPLALAERLSVRVTVRFDSEASARATGSRPSEQGQSSRIQDDQEPSI